MATRINRRRFLHTSAALGAAGFWSGRLSGDDKKPPPSERLQIGVVGVSGKGESDWQEIVAGGAEVVGYADVDERLIGVIQSKFPRAKFYPDFRKLLDQKGLEGLVVATPDHAHALAMLAGLRAGLHVFCEKPLTHTVEEARLVAETAARHKRVTQMGTQIHAGDNYRRVVELVRAQAIGAIRAVHVWCGKSWGGGDRPKGSEPIPAGLHWDLWLGAAPTRPFVHGGSKAKQGIYHTFNWRGWWDFGGGTLADMACHYMDLPFWALKLRHPTKVSAEGPPPHPESTPAWLKVDYDFPARGELPPVKLTWHDGGKRPPHFADGKLPKWGDGVLFVGDKGLLLADYSRHLLLPEKDYQGFTPPQPTIPRSIGHYKEWVEACKHNGATTCPFDYAGALTEAVLLGNVSYRCGKSLNWDAKNLKAIDAPEAERYVRKEYRKPWSLQG